MNLPSFDILEQSRSGARRLKSVLRKKMRAERRALSGARQTEASKGLLRQLLTLTEFESAGNVAMYQANDGEIDPCMVRNWCWRNGRAVFLPVVTQTEKNALVFAEVTKETIFKDNKYGIKEPVTAADATVSAKELDLVLMPLVAFDLAGNRVGMGGGYYDGTFEFIKHDECGTPRLIGVAHEIQKVDSIGVEPWDIALTAVVTDCGVYDFSG